VEWQNPRFGGFVFLLPISTHIYMEKLARKTSTDPVQEKLRQNKDLWNKEVSRFIESMKQLKKTMNGYPSRISPQKGKIQEPIQGNPVAALDALTTAFEQIADHGNSIVQEQLVYSKSRRKKQPKQPGLPQTGPAPTATPTSAPAPDLSQQLSGTPLAASMSVDAIIKLADEYEDLVVEGSNPLTRFFAKLMNPGIGWTEAANKRRDRMKWLKACAKAYKALEKFQVAIVGTSKESVSNSSKISQDIWDLWSSVSRGFANYKSKLPKPVAAPPGEKENTLVDSDDPEERNPLPNTVETPVSPDVPAQPVATPVPPQNLLADAEKIKRDYIWAQNSGQLVDAKVWDSFFAALTPYTMGGKNKANYAPALIDAYNTTLAALNSTYGTNGASFRDVAQQKISKETGKTSTAQLEVTAQDFLKKWFGKKRHQLKMFDETSSDRIRLFEQAEDMRTDLDSIMNLLEKDLNVESLSPIINAMNSKMTSFRGMMRALNNTVNIKRR
jgi:hypothetical protein